jgi:hypothetical protein
MAFTMGIIQSSSGGGIPITYPSLSPITATGATINHKRTTSNGKSYIAVYTGYVATQPPTTIKTVTNAGPSGARIFTQIVSLTQNTGYSNLITNVGAELTAGAPYTVFIAQENAGGALDGSLYYYGTFTTKGSVIVRFTGNGILLLPDTISSLEYLCVAGGGGGGSASNNIGYGGGGAGGYLAGIISNPVSDNYICTVGTGGNGSTSGGESQVNGGNSSVSGTSLNLVSHGGGKGASTNVAAGAGGSGGGGCNYGGGAGGEGGTIGHNGGGSTTNGGGGGGATSAGGTSAGGNGTSNSISGSAVTYAVGGAGGIQGGGAGTNGTVNTGNGGKGAGSTFAGGKGGSGVIIFKYTF